MSVTDVLSVGRALALFIAFAAGLALGAVAGAFAHAWVTAKAPPPNPARAAR